MTLERKGNSEPWGFVIIGGKDQVRSRKKFNANLEVIQGGDPIGRHKYILCQFCAQKIVADLSPSLPPDRPPCYVQDRMECQPKICHLTII